MAAEALGVAGAGSAGSACPAGSRVAKQQAALPAVAALTAEAAHPLDGAIGRPAQATGTADAAGAEGKRAVAVARCPLTNRFSGQRTPQQRLGGRIDQVEQILLNRLRGCRLSDGVGVTAGGEGPDKLFMKHRRLGTQRLICPSMRSEQRGYGRRYLVAAGCDQCRGRCRRSRVGCTNRRTDVRQICCRRCDQLRHHDEIGHQGPPASWKPGGRPVTIEPSAKAIAIAPTRPAFPRDLPCVSPVRLGTFQPGSARSARWPRLGRRGVSEFAKCRVGTSTVDGGRSTVHQDGDPDGLSGFLRCSTGPYRGLGV